MELLEGIQTRRSTRAFKSTPIPEETIRKVLQAAGQSPSYTNTQPWEVAVVTGKKRDELSQRIYDLSNAGAKPNPDMTPVQGWPPEMERRSMEHAARRCDTVGVKREDKAGRKEMTLANFKFYGAPCALFLFMDRSLGTWSIFDMGLFAQSICLAAHSFGLGSCLQAQLNTYPDVVRECLGLPQTKRLIIGISMGYPDLDASINTYRSSRVGLDQLVRWYI